MLLRSSQPSYYLDGLITQLFHSSFSLSGTPFVFVFALSSVYVCYAFLYESYTPQFKCKGVVVGTFLLYSCLLARPTGEPRKGGGEHDEVYHIFVPNPRPPTTPFTPKTRTTPLFNSKSRSIPPGSIPFSSRIIKTCRRISTSRNLLPAPPSPSAVLFACCRPARANSCSASCAKRERAERI